MTLPFDLSPTATTIIIAVILIAGFIRGCSGFGYPVIVIAAGGLFMTPLLLVPVAIIGDMILCLPHGHAARPHVNWPTVRRLIAGAVLGLLPGVYVLRMIDAGTARIVISSLVLLASLVMLTGWVLPKGAGPSATLGMGAVSGLAAPAGVAGPPAVMLVTALGLPPPVFRATLLAAFIILDTLSVGQFWLAGRIDADVLWAALVSAPLVVFASAFGAKRVMRTDPMMFRRITTVPVLMVMAVAGLWRALG